MFKIGDKVSHPSFGVGDVENIEEKKVLGQKEKYYILKLMVNEMTLMVPVNKAEEIGLRYIIDPETVPDVLNVLGHRIDDEMDGNYKQRIRSQTEMVDSGDILKVAQVVKNYTHRDNVEKLSSTERGLYDRARKILVGEISVACNIEQRYKKFLKKKNLVEKEKERLKEVIIHATQKVNELLNKLVTTPLSEATTLATLLTRPEVTYNQTSSIDPNRQEFPAEVTEQVEIQIKYAGYIKRQEIQVKRFKKLENYKIPKDIDYFNMHGISHEGKERFSEIQPISLGQAKRIPGITPSDIAALMINIEKIKRVKRA